MTPSDPLPGLAELKEDARPTAPRIPGVSDADRARGRRLRGFHDIHRQELAQIRAILARIEAGTGGATDLVRQVGDLEIARNVRMFGAACGRGCWLLNFHHDHEERETFPLLERRGGDGLRAVVAKLREEHRVVHVLVAALQDRAEAFAEAPDEAALAAVHDALDGLEAVVRSHFGYEEAELEEALGVYDAI